MKSAGIRTYEGLIIVFGLPGTGKTTLAKAIADKLKGCHLNTDIIREAMGLRGHYSKKEKLAVYGELFRRAKFELASGNTVILDGTFSSEIQREEVRKMANQMNKPLFWIETHADEQVVKERVSKIRPFTQADYFVYTRVRNEWHPFNEPHLTVQTDSHDIHFLLEEVLEWLSKSYSTEH